jgi:hypothetical protein
LLNDASPSPGWVAHRVRWPYRLGEIPIGSVSFRMLQRDEHFTKLGDTLDLASLPRLPASSGFAGSVIRSQPCKKPPPALQLKAGYLISCPASYRRQWIEFRGTFDGYLQKFSAKTRSTLARKVRRFREAAGASFDFRAFKVPEEMEEFFRLAREVSEKTYQERLLDAGLPASEEFRAGLSALAKENRVRGYILSMEGRPVAYLYCPVHPGTRILLYQYLGYDPDIERLSPGTVLQYLALEDLFREGDLALFDFLEGETPQKELFATGSTLCADLYFFRPTLRVVPLVVLRHGVEGLSSIVVRLFEVLGVKRWLKRLIRRGHVPRTSR